MKKEEVMYRALVCCRAGMGSSMMLKIKSDQVIKENEMPIITEHGNLESIKKFDGDLIITMVDLVDELKDAKPYAVGVLNIVDKDEIKGKLDEFLAYKQGE
jgi:PTS system ascorbate-specific IIB component